MATGGGKPDHVGIPERMHDLTAPWIQQGAHIACVDVHRSECARAFPGGPGVADGVRGVAAVVDHGDISRARCQACNQPGPLELDDAAETPAWLVIGGHQIADSRRWEIRHLENPTMASIVDHYGVIAAGIACERPHAIEYPIACCSAADAEVDRKSASGQPDGNVAGVVGQFVGGGGRAG
jgi:hypothetical protein